MYFIPGKDVVEAVSLGGPHFILESDQKRE